MNKSDKPPTMPEVELISDTPDEQEMHRAIQDWLTGGEDISDKVQNDPEWRDVAIHYLRDAYRVLPSKEKILLTNTLFLCLKEGGIVHDAIKQLAENPAEIVAEKRQLVEQALRLRIALQSSVAEFRENDEVWWGKAILALVDIDESLQGCGPLLLHIDEARHDKIVGDRLVALDKWYGYAEKQYLNSVTREEIERFVDRHLKILLPDDRED